MARGSVGERMPLATVRGRGFRWLVTAAVICVGVGGLASAQNAGGKKPLTYAAYDGWRSIQGQQLSRDGKWVVYSLAPQEGNGELVVRSVEGNTEHRHPRGTGAQFTADGRYVVFTVVPSKAEADEAKKKKTPADRAPKNALGILTLADGKVVVVPRIKGFRLPEEGSRAVAYHREAGVKEAPASKPAAASGGDISDAEHGEVNQERSATAHEVASGSATAGHPFGSACPFPRDSVCSAGNTGSSDPQHCVEISEGAERDQPAAAEKKPEKKKDPGTELVVRDLASGKEEVVPEVVDYAWNRDGSWLAYAVSSATPVKDGVYARRDPDGSTRALLTGTGHYRSLRFDEKGAQLAFLSDRDAYQAETPAWKLYHWAVKAERAAELAGSGTPGVPKGWVISEHRGPTFSKDGERLFLGTAPAPKARPKDAPETVNVDIWHFRDPYLQTMQKVRAASERNRSYLAVVHLDGRRLVQLGTPEVPDVRATDDDTWTLGDSDLPYRQLVSWDGSYSDYYLVSLRDGSRKKVVTRSRNGATLSPGGKYALYFDDEKDAYFTYRIRDGRVVNLTEKLEIPLVIETWDSPAEPAPYGSAGWTEGDRSVVLYDRYDLWEFPADGGAPRSVTRGQGRSRKLVFRYQRTDPEERFLPSAAPLLLHATDERTKASGYYRVPLAGDTEPQQAVMLDKMFTVLVKAKDADIFLYRLQRFDEYPDLWVSDTRFGGMRRLSEANPQQAQYLWGKSELIDFLSQDGKPLQAILTKPENFDPLKRYPLMVHIYERRSNNLHAYWTPAPGTSVNLSRYASNGYLILQPDIAYTPGYPGESAMKCVLPAIQKVVDQGIVDPARIGIQGHSWGGYQISYMITRTNLFRAVEAGASVTNMVSAYGGIRWTSGMSRAFQYEKTQSRIGGAPWERPLQYIENSPVFWADKVQTPYLSIHNDADGAVPWYQGIEFFTALRRLGKEAYLFNYNGEDHGLRTRLNQKHWTVHMDEFFDHYLKGAPRPGWMENGVPYLERGTRDIQGVFR